MIAANREKLRENLSRVKERIAEAERRAGRAADSVRLIGVAKYVSSDLTRELIRLGCNEIGESRPQQLRDRANEIHELGLSWHLIGSLQRNKAKYVAAHADWVHSVDSLELLLEMEKQCERTNRTIHALLEVNVSGDSSKHGFSPGALQDALSRIPVTRFTRIVGLMTMASLEGGTEQARRDFAGLRSLRDSMLSNSPKHVLLGELSMGMTDDFEVAIEEGSTVVRIGSALWEGIDTGGG